jgi:transposase
MKKPTITEDTIEAICRTLRLGAYKKEAAAAAGVPLSTLHLWISRAGKEHRHIAEGGKPRKSNALFLKLLDGIEKAQAEAQLSDLAIITRAAQDGAWQAAAWKLERRNPNQWGRQRVDIETEGRLVIEGAPWLTKRLKNADG